MTLPIAILAGGLATRLLPVTSQIPKSLVDVGGRPFAEHQIELLQRNGITDIVFLVGHLGEMVRDALGDGARWGVTLRYVFDGPNPLGTGGSVAAALPHLGDRFFVLYGDSYLECDYAAIEQAFVASGKSGLMTICRNDNRWDRSNVLFTDGRIVSYNKDRQLDQMQHIDYGLGALSGGALTHDKPPFDLASVYQRLLAHDDLAAFEVPGRFYEIGSHQGLAETRAYLSARHSEAR
jgi:N-acetyl-alpha-D-muramate 1-phosphate uridylyltransferase